MQIGKMRAFTWPKDDLLVSGAVCRMHQIQLTDTHTRSTTNSNVSYYGQSREVFGPTDECAVRGLGGVSSVECRDEARVCLESGLGVLCLVGSEYVTISSVLCDSALRSVGQLVERLLSYKVRCSLSQPLSINALILVALDSFS